MRTKSGDFAVLYCSWLNVHVVLDAFFIRPFERALSLPVRHLDGEMPKFAKPTRLVAALGIWLVTSSGKRMSTYLLIPLILSYSLPFRCFENVKTWTWII